MKRAHLILALAAVVGAAASVPARAEIEPKYYRIMQERSPEHATVRVISVRTSVERQKHSSGSFTIVSTKVEAQAQVTAVAKTSTGLKAGDPIRIEYVSQRAEPPMAGPRPIPVVKAGETYPAFMVGVSKGLYGAAARGASFEPLVEAK